MTDSNYPFLDRFKNNTTANKFEPSTKLLSTSSLVPTAGPRISSPATSGGHKDIRSRVGAKVTTSEKKRIKIRQQQATKVSRAKKFSTIFQFLMHCTKIYSFVEDSQGLGKGQGQKGHRRGGSQNHDFGRIEGPTSWSKRR